jgi:Stage II sporulation protein E (SpoIIE)
MPDDDATDLESRAGRALLEVLRRTHLSAAADLATVLAEEARTLGIDSLVLYLIDYEQKLLVPVPSPEASGREPLPVVGTMAGRAFASTSIVQVEADGGRGRRMWLPLLDGTERLGVMDAGFLERSVPMPPELVAVIERYAHLAALLVATKGLYSDVFELVRRRRPMTVASELLWENVPPLLHASEDFVLSALLEPCYDNGGDAFDYALNGGVLHIGVFDAMGHGLAAAGAVTYALSLYRHSRRRGLGPQGMYESIDAALDAQATTARFVTAVLAQLDVRTGHLRWVSAGHPSPLLLRDGRFIKTLDVEPSPPLGVQLATGPAVEGTEALQPGDMVLLYTDGLTEARRPGGDLFTVERLGHFIERQAANGRAAPETLRLLREAIIERGEGALRDDATAVLVEWRRDVEGVVVPETV